MWWHLLQRRQGGADTANLEASDDGWAGANASGELALAESGGLADVPNLLANIEGQAGGMVGLVVVRSFAVSHGSPSALLQFVDRRSAAPVLRLAC